MGRQFTISGNRRPAVVQNLQMRRALVHHRLDRQHHPFLQARIRHPGPEVIRHLRILVQAAADPVTREFRDHRKARALRGPLDGPRDIADPIAGARLLDSRRRARSRVTRIRRCASLEDVTNHDRPGRVTKKTLVRNAKVEPDDIARLELASRLRDTVDDLFIDRHAKTVTILDLMRAVPLESRAGPA